MGISRCQQSMKGILWKIDCQLIANERGRGGGGGGSQDYYRVF